MTALRYYQTIKTPSKHKNALQIIRLFSKCKNFFFPSIIRKEALTFKPRDNLTTDFLLLTNPETFLKSSFSN